MALWLKAEQFAEDAVDLGDRMGAESLFGLTLYGNPLTLGPEERALVGQITHLWQDYKRRRAERLRMVRPMPTEPCAVAWAVPVREEA
jgi:hypothetical protein